jgi:Protein of unknown function (DUF1236)
VELSPSGGRCLSDAEVARFDRIRAAAPAGQEMTRSATSILALLLWPLAAAALAQAPAPDESAATPRLNLTLEQRHVIKEVVKDMKIAPAATSVRSVGDAIPADAALQAMPSDISRKVPQVRTHRFLVTAERILIVDPKDNKVAEVIELN